MWSTSKGSAYHSAPVRITRELPMMSLSLLTVFYCRYLLTSLEAGLQYLTSNQLPAAMPNEEKSLESATGFVIRSDSVCTSEKSEVDMFFEASQKQSLYMQITRSLEL